jgi:hypothetical protein
LTPPVIDGNLDFLPHHSGGSKLIVDHCNGLLLYRDGETLCVVNPATRRWEHLPCWQDYDCRACLVFDPAASLCYEVISIPREPEKVVLNPSVANNQSTIVDTEQDLSTLHIKKKVKLTLEQYEEGVDLSTGLASPPIQRRGEHQDPHDSMEFPPSSWTLNVFSSSTKQWKKKAFICEAEATGATSSMPLDLVEPRPLGCSVYWQGSTYLHFQGAFIVRYTFQLICKIVFVNVCTSSLSGIESSLTNLCERIDIFAGYLLRIVSTE